MLGPGTPEEQCIERACSGPVHEEQVVTSRLQSDLLHMDHVMQHFTQGLIQTELQETIIGVGPFVIVLAGIWSLVAFCLNYARRVRKNAVAAPQFMERFRYHLAASGVRYLIPIGIATAFYVLLWCYSYWFRDSLSEHSLIAMQHAFIRAKLSFDRVKLSGVKILVGLVAIYLLSCVLLSPQRPGNNEHGGTAGAGNSLRRRARLVATLYRAVGIYSKCSGPLAVLLATLASFTLFGTQLGEPAKNLQLRVKEVQAEYTEVTKRTEAELSERVTSALYTKIRDTFPSSYQEALKLPAEIDSEVKNVQQYADDAKSRYGVSDPGVERTLQDEQARIKKVNELKSDLRIEDTERKSVPENTTYDQIEAARKALGSHREDKGIELAREGSKKIFLQTETLVGGEQIMRLAEPLISEIPIVEPLMRTFAEACDKTVEEPIGKYYDRVIEAAMQNPQDLEMVVQREANTIVDKTDIHTLVERATPQAQQQSEKLKQTLSSLPENKLRIDRDVAEISPLPDAHLPPRGSPDRITPPKPVNPSESEIQKLPRKLPPELTRRKFRLPG